MTTALLTVAPVAFVVGVVVGLAASSRWRIVRRADRPGPGDGGDTTTRGRT